MRISQTCLKSASWLALSLGASSCAAQTAPQTATALPQAALPQVALPQAALPQVALPQAALPQVALPTATELLPQGGGAFKSYGLGPEKAAVETLPAVGQTFSQALRLTTITPPARFYDYGSTTPLIAPVKAGDVLWVSVRLRRITTLKESGEVQTELAFLQQVDGKEVRSLERLVSFGGEWTQFDIPFIAKADSAVGEARFGVRFGYGKQSFELGGLRLLNYGPNVKLDALPRSQIRYDGWKPDAPWRRAADERIERIRKGDLTIKVVNAAGKPVAGAQVEVRMKRHAFGWGSAVADERINDRTNPDNERYRQTFEGHFNKAVIENNLKWGRWLQPKTRESALAALPWFAARGVPVRGHVMVWPSWGQMPKSVFTEEVKKDPEAMKQLVSERISEQTVALRGQLTEWDVANETFRHHDLLDILGRDVMVEWFKQARIGAPGVKLFYNDYTMFQAGEGQDYFYQTIKELKDKGAPIDGIGEQAHFASSPPGIPAVLSTLDRFGALGLPIQFTEFDIDTDDAGLQADFMRDFTTVAFSHPSVMGVMQWGFWEGAHWLPRAALWNKNWVLRPHGKVWVDLVFKKWWTNADGQTDQNGAYRTRGFYGDYEIAVSRGGQSQTSKFALSPQNGALTVFLR